MDRSIDHLTSFSIIITTTATIIIMTIIIISSSIVEWCIIVESIIVKRIDVKTTVLSGQKMHLNERMREGRKQKPRTNEDGKGEMEKAVAI